MILIIIIVALAALVIIVGNWGYRQPQHHDADRMVHPGCPEVGKNCLFGKHFMAEYDEDDSEWAIWKYTEIPCGMSLFSIERREDALALIAKLDAIEEEKSK